MIKLCLLAFASLLAAAPAMAADAYASDWVKGLKSSARLIAAGGEETKVYRAGVEIALEPQTITYWRAPGDAGVPPVFTFRNQQNIQKIEVLYPAPARVSENGAELFGYQGGVIFPVHITALDPAKPVTLDLMLDYAACEKICIPAQAHLTLNLPAAKSPPGPHAGRIALAEARVPEKQDAGAAKALTLRALTRKAVSGKPVFEAEIVAPAGVTDISVFPETPDYWFIKAGAAAAAPGNVFRVAVTVEDKPRDANEVKISLTIVAAGQSIEVTKLLDVAAAKP